MKKWQKKDYLLGESIMNKCIGCGVVLQNTDSNNDGYVENLEHNLCKRCFMIKNYNKNPSLMILFLILIVMILILLKSVIF